VIGLGSYHGRQDDLLTDLRAWNGRDIMIVTNNPRSSDSVEAGLRARREAAPSARRPDVCAPGEGFNYSVYRRQVLQVIADRYYRIPRGSSISRRRRFSGALRHAATAAGR
jgi:hypothetical protein